MDPQRANAPLDVSAVVSSLTPSDGPLSGGTSIDIQGSGFTDAIDVVIGGTVVTASCPSAGGCFTENSDTDISAVTPPGVAGSSDVTVDNASFSGTPNPPADDYTYLDTPTVTDVPSPQNESATGITVTGTGFSQPGPDISAVTEVDLVPTFTGPTVALTTLCANPGDPDCFGFTSATHLPIDLPATDILPGQYDTVVKTPGGTSTTSGSDQFVVQQAVPTVTSVSPDSGPEAGGAPAITIHGTNFTGSGFVTAGVSFGGIPAAGFSVTNATTISATPPAGSGLVHITVTTSSTDGTSLQTSATSSTDTYVFAPVPTVTGVSPSTGATGGANVVTVNGTGFEANNAPDASFAATHVVVDTTDISTSPCSGSPASPCFTVTSPTKITIGYMPTHGAGTIDITVETVGGTSATSANDKYTYQPVPAVTGVSPTAGPLGGTNTVTLSGSDFTNASDVTVDTTPITANPCPGTVTSPCFTVVSASSITINDLPSDGPGTVDITVETPAGTSAITPADEYAYAPVPTVTNVTPGNGPLAGRNTITVAGSGFMSGSLFSATRVTVDTTPISTTPCPGSPVSACFTVTSAGSITVKELPSDSAGTVDITVTTAGGTSATTANDQYVYVPAPTVTGVSPSDGPAAGGNGITVTGTDFEGAGFAASDVLVGLTDISTQCPGNPCFNLVSSTTITIPSMPSHAVGTLDITVTSPGGTSATSASDEYIYEPLPTVTGVVPPAGVLVGGSTVTVNGSGFTNASGNASVVNIGSVIVLPCPGSPCFNIVSASQITVDTFPASASPATVDITVTTPFGTSLTTSADAYTYMPIPTVTNVSPSNGSTLGGIAVTLTGTGFEFGGVSATAVTFVGLANPNPGFTVNSATSITIQSFPPDLPGGMVDITVTTAGGTSALSSADQFTYVATFPSVTTVSPKFGAASGDAYVTIDGQNFGNPNLGFGATEVVFGTGAGAVDVPASNTFPCSGSAGCFEQIGDGLLEVYTPAVAAGLVDITVVTPGGTSGAGLADEYTFVAPGAYTAINPFRICDTRPPAPGIASNPCDSGGHGTLGTGHETVIVQITGTHVPAGAQAVVVNITAINHGTGGTYVVAYPAGGTAPVASNINLPAEKVGSNLAIVDLGSAPGFLGQIALFNALGSADVIVDVEGYFAAPSGSIVGAFHSIPPLRICDSRGGSGDNTVCATATGHSSAPLTANAWRRVTVSGVPPGVPMTIPHIPTDGTAAAAVFNLTATAGTAPTYLSVAVPTAGDACPTTPPAFSNLNPAPGTSLPNRVISQLGPTQDICLYSALGTINFVIDVNGWFGAAGAPAGAFFYAVPPTRICDTRPSNATGCVDGELTANHSLTIGVANVIAVPAWNVHAPPPLAVVANLTGVAGTAATYFTLYPSDQLSPPRASDLNPSTGEVIANLAITSLAQTGGQGTEGNVSLYNALGDINAILDVAGWFQ
jgi:hypothetical protein